jgi:predicted glycosyltransferase
MKILFDIGHPAHFHYFKNFIKYLKENEHKVYISARNRDIIFELISRNNLEYIDRGKGKTSFLGKLFYLISTDLKLFFFSIKNKIDFSVGFPSTYAAHASFLRGKKHYAFNDTEHASFEKHLYPFFCFKIFTPYYFKEKINSKQLFFNGFMELSYLDKKYFKPDFKCVYSILKTEKYAVIRFIKWGNASHDWGKIGLNKDEKKQIIQTILDKGFKVAISSEDDSDFFSDDNIIKIPSHLFHEFIYYANFVISEGGTTCNEAALLGVPNILINPLLKKETKPGAHIALENEKLQICFEKYPDNIISIIDEISTDEFQIKFKKRNIEFLKDKISPTDILIREFENNLNNEK